tara:strand:- start:379 stop:513 length:135 start_codon:yes stop_codon:yes gene_type:complete
MRSRGQTQAERRALHFRGREEKRGVRGLIFIVGGVVVAGIFTSS